MPTEEQVELCPAYVWDCPECGRENFQRAITHVPTEEDVAENPELEWGAWMTRPNFVVCRHADCGRKYPAKDIREGE